MMKEKATMKLCIELIKAVGHRGGEHATFTYDTYGKPEGKPSELRAIVISFLQTSSLISKFPSQNFRAF